MDTKSKKFNRNFALRFCAAMLLTVLLLINSYSVAKLSRGLVLFGVSATTSEKEPVTQTASFAGETKALLRYLAMAVSADRDGDSTQDTLSEKHEQLKDSYAAEIALNSAIISDYEVCSKLISNGMTITDPAARGYEPVDEYDDGSYEPATDDETAETANIAQGYWYYRFLESDYKSIEEYAADKSGYGEYISSLKAMDDYYSANAESVSSFIASVKSMKYYIIDNKTGVVLSNIEGCQTAADGQKAMEAVRGCAWYIRAAKDAFSSNDPRSYSATKSSRDFYSWFGITPGCPDGGIGIELEKSTLLPVSPYYWAREIIDESNDYTVYLGYGCADEIAKCGTDGFALIESEYGSFSFTKKDGIIMGAIALINLMLFVFLIAITGKGSDGKPRKYLIDKLWNDVHLALSGAVCVGLTAIPFGMAEGMTDTVIGNHTLFAAVCALCFTLLVMVVIEWLTSVVRHARMKTFFRHTFCWKFLALCFKPFVLLFRYMKELILVKNMPKWTAVAFGGVLALSLFFTLLSTGYNGAFWFFMIVVIDAALLAAFTKAFTSLSKIMKTVEEAKNGNPSAKVDVNKTFCLYREFAKNVNTVNDGIQTAVDSAVRDQKTKAELITNVSHDLKTPLTSIVTYVDLLKRCGVEGEEANKYIDILDEKSQRLKKLVEDLVEASKVSSGAVELHPVKLNLCEMAVQAVGENCEALEKDGIETLYKAPEAPVFIMADGQKTSRVIENLFSNVCKYAMPGTRVYIDVTCNGKFGALTIKNVSRYPLNISAEELKQRFVRGDEARTSEGSGLGLSIAQNLCALQGGGCDIEIDGDLFKATVFFPQVQ